MRSEQSLSRKSHFLGTKIRNLRKRNHLTMEDLSARCIRLNPESAPSVSYLSMIERGKRVPSQQMLEVIAAVFQKEISWFLDEMPEQEAITPEKGRRGGISGMALEPGFLFSQDILQIAIPEMLSQTGISGRQFAHLLIRAHQEHHQNHFPDLERVAEEIGNKQLGLTVDDLTALLKKQGVKIKWFDEPVSLALDDMGGRSGRLTTSYFEAPGTIFLNKALKRQTTRLKYDLAVHLGHSVLHSVDASRSPLSAGRTRIEQDADNLLTTPNPQDILHAWRDFEASFFAGALLCPKVPYRQLLDQHGYEISVHQKIDVSPSVAMRRMTVASPYPHWHYFDAYAPGKLKAVYRGNGIPLPWGNMRQVKDPCQHWAVFRMINAKVPGESSAQLSLLNVNGEPRIYCCESLQVADLAGNPHVLCAGIDLNPAIDAQDGNALELARELKQICVDRGGSAPIPLAIRKRLQTVSRILNINWIERAIASDARLICSRGAVCPRDPSCYHTDE
ncbi:DUF3612 domain-containing protein [Shewanella sp. GXUN23E]|uniref:DUF3612 domain-containing protein n=1 Tax=Shewanella sp. GXUN23E TaxID=3422498 RepID=UPI003D7D05F4